MGQLIPMEDKKLPALMALLIFAVLPFHGNHFLTIPAVGSSIPERRVLHRVVGTINGFSINALKPVIAFADQKITRKFRYL